MTRIAVIPGDGIGVEVTREAVAALREACSVTGGAVELCEFPYGAEHFLKTGETLPHGALDRLREFDAILLGALGDPRVPDNRHAADILLGLRFALDLYVNQRPVRLLDDRLCPLKGRTTREVDFVIFRENTEGLYVGMGGFFKKGTPDEVAVQEDVNTRKGVERICRHAFEYAASMGRRRVLMADKSNVLTYGHDLWQRVFREVARGYPAIEASHMYADALAMQMVREPAQFAVIVTCNLFGDILSDLGAALQGGLGMAASANLHPGRIGLFEPVHGSAPKHAGKDVANPMGAILTAAMLLDQVNRSREAHLLEQAVAGCVREGRTTRDLGGPLGTRQVGDEVRRRVRQASGTF
ncbi:MAG TPA: 3-isopropylmalate dehydrogenase [Candidatus Polarisedimenticolia bacterium]|nr:3-isopropylmalate dehydrogenase [Candidatus Polarisedimenticolia bacterium]